MTISIRGTIAPASAAASNIVLARASLSALRSAPRTKEPWAIFRSDLDSKQILSLLRTEQTEQTEQTETRRDTFRPFRFFRLFRNPLTLPSLLQERGLIFSASALNLGSPRIASSIGSTLINAMKPDRSS